MQFFRLRAAYGDAPPDGLKSPFRWGTEEGLRELVGHGSESVRIERRKTRMFYRSPGHAVDVIRRYFGPTMLTFDSLEQDDAKRLHDDLIAMNRRNNVSTDGTMVEELEYVLAVATRA